MLDCNAVNNALSVYVCRTFVSSGIRSVVKVRRRGFDDAIEAGPGRDIAILDHVQSHDRVIDIFRIDVLSHQEGLDISERVQRVSHGHRLIAQIASCVGRITSVREHGLRDRTVHQA